MNEKCIEKLWIMMNLTHEFPISFFRCCNAGDEFIIITYLDDMKVTVVTNVCSWTVFHEILIDLAAEICGKIFERVHALQKWQNLAEITLQNLKFSCPSTPTNHISQSLPSDLFEIFYDAFFCIRFH